MIDACSQASASQRRRGARPESRGVTLVELIMVLTIVGVFAVFAGNALIEGARAYNQISPTLASQAQLRFAMDRIARELREIGTAGVPRTYSITTPATPTPGANTIAFTKNDGTTVTIDGSSGTAVNITYSSPAATGRLADIAATNALSFNFYDHNTNGATNSTGYETYTSGTDNLGAIQFTLKVTVSGIESTATTRVALRSTQ